MRRFSDKDDELIREAVANVLGRGAPARELTRVEWRQVAASVPRRTAKQCRMRWETKLSPRLVTGGWTEDEHNKLAGLIQTYGRSWRSISEHLPGRSATCVKNYFYSFMRRVSRREAQDGHPHRRLQPIHVCALPVSAEPWAAGHSDASDGTDEHRTVLVPGMEPVDDGSLSARTSISVASAPAAASFLPLPLVPAPVPAFAPGVLPMMFMLQAPCVPPRVSPTTAMSHPMLMLAPCAPQFRLAGARSDAPGARPLVA